MQSLHLGRRGTEGDSVHSEPASLDGDDDMGGADTPDHLPPHSASLSALNSALDFTGASIRDSHPGDGRIGRAAPSIVLPNQDAEYVSHIALDIGGSLIKLVYFSPDPVEEGGAAARSPVGSSSSSSLSTSISSSQSSRGGRMHFVKFETARIDDCLDFIEAKGLHRHYGRDGASHEMRVKATGGGAHKYADVFKERLGLVLEREDEINCAVAGCNFLLKAISYEAFLYENGNYTFVPTNVDGDGLYPYLLVTIGSGVSIVKVEGDGQYERVSGSSVGGGTFWGLCQLLTGLRDFDEMLELSAQGNNANVDMLVGDIYGGRDYTNIGLSANTIASSFGKVVSQDKNLKDYNGADIAMSLCRMIAYNIGQLAFLNAKRYNLKRVYFGGFFIRGHPYTMETISFAFKFWSKGEMNALFLRHEGFLGAVGAFLKVHPINGAPGAAAYSRAVRAASSRKVRARFVERFSMGAPFAGGEVRGPAIRDMSDRVSWVEKFVAVGAAAQEAAQKERPQAQVDLPSMSLDRTISSSSDFQPSSPTFPAPARMSLHVGVLHFYPTLEPFPLLADPAGYTPNTIDINADEEEYQWLLKVLEDQIPTVVEKAVASEGGGDGPRRRATAFARAFAAHLRKLRQEPGAYGQLGLSDLFELREECLREFGFSDVYRLDKERENAVALQVLPDLLTELDAMEPRERLLAVITGILAANIFDWGARACVALYRNGTILDIYREARQKLSRRPWRVDEFDDFCERVYGPSPSQEPVSHPPFRRVLIFVDNAGADVVLGVVPFARELLRMGCEVVLAANSLPAINDITAPELRSVISAAAEMCPIIKTARQAAVKAESSLHHHSQGHVPPYPGMTRRASSHHDLQSMSQPGSHALHLHGAINMPSSSHIHRRSPSGYSPSQPNARLLATDLSGSSPSSHHLASPSQQQGAGSSDQPLASAIAGLSMVDSTRAPTVSSAASEQRMYPANEPHESVPQQAFAPAAAAAAATTSTSSASNISSSSGEPSGVPSSSGPVVPKLFVVSNGHGGPCLDLTRVPNTLADATVGVDLLVIEGMGRAIHTNLRAQFRCDVLKLAMIKTERLALKLFNGALYDCLCMYTRAPASSPAHQQPVQTRTQAWHSLERRQQQQHMQAGIIEAEAAAAVSEL